VQRGKHAIDALRTVAPLLLHSYNDENAVKKNLMVYHGGPVRLRLRSSSAAYSMDDRQ
jgi:hypothetical protein